jgi:nucleoside-diphosphate-sugar epimerase
MSFIHLDDAAATTVFALERDGPALYNITDDEASPADLCAGVMPGGVRGTPAAAGGRPRRAI